MVLQLSEEVGCCGTAIILQYHFTAELISYLQLTVILLLCLTQGDITVCFLFQTLIIIFDDSDDTLNGIGLGVIIDTDFKRTLTGGESFCCHDGCIFECFYGILFGDIFFMGDRFDDVQYFFHNSTFKFHTSDKIDVTVTLCVGFFFF